jgi:hypothetical protein
MIGRDSMLGATAALDGQVSLNKAIVQLPGSGETLDVRHFRDVAEQSPACPLPNHWLRNGRLNQTAFSLYLFIRDVAGGDLVAWIDRRLQAAAKQSGPDRLARMRMAVLDPLKEVYGAPTRSLRARP